MRAILTISHVIVVLLRWTVWSKSAKPFNFTWPTKRAAEIDGDIVLGGLMMVHERQEDITCGPIMPQGGIQALETMLFTIDTANEELIASSGFTIGAHVLDDCDKDTYGLEQAIAFIKGSISNIDDTKYKCSDGSTPEVRNKIVSGVVGASSSVTSVQVANLLRLFKIPQVSFFSTSPELSNKQRFEYFSRTIPSDLHQVKAMAQIILQLGWTYISVLYEESNYGVKAFEELEILLGQNNVCIAVKEKLVKDSGVAEEAAYDSTVKKLLAKPRARGVIIFGSDQEVSGVMRAVRRNNATGLFSWIGSDGWSARSLVSDGNEPEVEGTLSVQPQANPVKGFDEYFLSLTPQNNRRNPWFTEFWEHHFQCRYPGSPNTPYNQNWNRTCSTLEKLSRERLEFEAQLQFVSDAVLAFAYAFRDMHKDICKGKPGLCREMMPVDGTELLKYLRKVRFVGLSGDHFQFDEFGDGPARYNIIHFKQLTPGRYKWVRVGEYTDGKLQLNIHELQFKFNDGNPPESFCSAPCNRNQAKKYLEGEGCCWKCVNCTQYQVRHPEDETQCATCPLGTLPDPYHVECVPIPEVYLKPHSGWAIGAMSFSGVGIIATSVRRILSFNVAVELDEDSTQYNCRIKNPRDGSKSIVLASTVAELICEAKAELGIAGDVKVFTEDGYEVKKDVIFTNECRSGRPVFVIKGDESASSPQCLNISTKIADASVNFGNDRLDDNSTIFNENLGSVSCTPTSLENIRVTAIHSSSSLDNLIGENVTFGDVLNDPQNTSRPGCEEIADLVNIEEVIANSSVVSRGRIQELLNNLKSRETLERRDIRLLTKVIGTWLFSKNGTKTRPLPEEFHQAAVSLVTRFPVTKDPGVGNGWEVWYDIKTRLGRLHYYVRDKRSSQGVARPYRKCQKSQELRFTDSLVLGLFIRHNNTPVVRASGRELSYVLLCGILFCFAVSFLFVLRPTNVVCGVQRVAIGACFSVVYAALFTKTNRIARIFQAAKMSARRPGFISPKSQLIICGALASVQGLICAAWLWVSPPSATHHYPSREDNLLVCTSYVDASYMMAFAYPIILILLCTVYAVLTRKIPAAFNESKYIGFTMYTTCIIWLAFVPIYFSTSSHLPLRITSMSVTISLSATVTLACLFWPKIYIIILRPERNVRQALTMPNNKTVSVDQRSLNEAPKTVQNSGINIELKTAPTKKNNQDLN